MTAPLLIVLATTLLGAFAIPPTWLGQPRCVTFGYACVALGATLGAYFGMYALLTLGTLAGM